ncbi:unnamed protein product [Lupinus luteus]|uniref:DUF7755 domain-containing protein n=1 Tax=Lupinus luteus TaxID=3873 RepID=A0AAV1Y6R6_LUPLU
MDHSAESGDITHVDMLHFQRGSVDEFIFKGPKIANTEALWIGAESGQPPEDGELRYTGYRYEFLVDNVLLGEGSELSMLELRHGHMSDLHRIDPISFFDKGLYDIASFSAGENAGFAFLIGGIQGFLHLLLLQRSVDALPASELITCNKGEALLGGLKGSIASVALVVGFAVFAVIYSSVDLQVTTRDLIVGMMGFLACKVSVVLAAFKPIKPGLKLPSDM